MPALTLPPREQRLHPDLRPGAAARDVALEALTDVYQALRKRFG